MGPIFSSPRQISSSASVGFKVEQPLCIGILLSSRAKQKMSPTVQPKTQLGQSLDFCTPPGFLSFSTSKNPSSPTKSVSFPHKIHHLNIRGVTRQGFVRKLDDDAPMWVELHPINSETQFYRVVAEAQQFEEPLVIVWMASWCRKCIYLKPKLEKLAADYYQRLQFYYVDVNTVPHKLVAHAGVTKMPTIQLWKDGKKQDEVIGGHKAYLVINDVRQMIENASTI